MNLTSLNRVKSALGITKSDQDGVISRLIPTASNRIAYYLKREDGIELKSRTEYLSPYSGQRLFRLKAYPITSIESIYNDSAGVFTTPTLVASTDYITDGDSRTVVFNSTASINNPLLSPGANLAYPKSMRVVYTAGLAADPVISSWTKSADTGGTLAVGNYIQGSMSLALAKITARAAGTISYECLYGVFVASETITEYTSVDSSLQDGGPRAPTGVTATLTASTAVSLAESYPDLVEACEMQVRFLLTNRNNFENLNVVQDGATRFSRSDLQKDYGFIPEIRDILDTYRNKVVYQ